MEGPILWSINEYDKDGDITEEGIYLHLGNTKIRVATDLEDFRIFLTDLNDMLPEITENWGD